jgi:PIN domain nuclease of toxin-antitoxin system
VKLLLDTHAALWWLADDHRVGTVAAALLADPASTVLLSAAVVWEVAIKRSLGKLDAPDDFAVTLIRAGSHPLPITVAHAEAVAGLEPHHRDPFDRMLVAQAAVEQAALVSSDPALHAYGVPIIW